MREYNLLKNQLVHTKFLLNRDFTTHRATIAARIIEAFGFPVAPTLPFLADSFLGSAISFSGAHIGAPLHLFCLFVLLSSSPPSLRFACVFRAHTSVRPYIVCPCVLVSDCLAVGADRCVCPIFLCLCVLGAHIGAPLHFVVLVSYCHCRRGRPVCLPGFSLLVCFWAHTSLRPYIFVFLFLCHIALP